MAAHRIPSRIIAAAAVLAVAGCASPPVTSVAGSPGLQDALQGQGSGDGLKVTAFEFGDQEKRGGVEAHLPLNGYSAGPGQEITFDATGSTGTITAYDWDLDGDGTFEKTTTDPVLTYTYPGTFDGSMILRVTGAGGATDTLTTSVHVGAYNGPVRVAPPANVRAVVVSADGTEAEITWESDDPAADSWGVAVNGFPVGRTEESARSVTVTDLERDKDVLLEIFGITAAGEVGIRAGTTLPAVK